jgi:hypothetical protein
MVPHDDRIESASGGTVTPRSSETGSSALTVASLFLTGALLVVVSCTRGSFNRIFTDFNTKMPAITNVVRSPSFVAMVVVLFGITIISSVVPRNRVMHAIWNKIAVVAVVILGSLYVLGMFYPLVRLVNLRT